MGSKLKINIENLLLKGKTKSSCLGVLNMMNFPDIFNKLISIKVLESFLHSCYIHFQFDIFKFIFHALNFYES